MNRNRALLWALLSATALAQTGPAWDGAFSTTQADRGRAAYREQCARCHGPDLAGGESTPPLAGAAFLTEWKSKSPADLLDRTRRTMPTDNPGGLSDRHYADIVAYVLSANRFRAGAADLGGAAVKSSGNSEWRFYGGDAGSTKYSPLDQINASNVKQLEIAWRWKAENFGPRPDYNWEVTPLMVGGVLYFTAGTGAMRWP